MWSAIPAQGRPARNALTVVVSCVNHTLKRVADATRSSARPAFFSSSAALEARAWGTSRAKKGLKLLQTLGLFPISQSHKLIQNFLQSLEPPFLCAKLFRMENSKLLPQPVCLRIRDSWNGFLSTHSLFQCSEKYLSIRYARMSILFSAD